MAKRKLDIFLGMDNAELKSKLNESTSLLKGFQTTIGGVLGGAALGVSIKSMGDFALNASKNFEQAQISFSKMLQSEKAGEKLINDIQNLANVTPMTSQSLANNARLLLNFNAVAADEVIPTLTMLGDITGGDQQRMDSLTLAFAQSASAGRLMGQDLLQMINAGFNPLQIMAEKTGKSIGTLKDEMSKGKITTDMVIQAFKDATAAGGKFAGMMEAQAQSKAGLEATKADSLEIFARTITERAMPALKEFDQVQIDAINHATEAVKQLNQWAEVNNQTTNLITNMALALATAVLGYKGLVAIVQTVSTAHLQAVAAIAAEREAKIAVTQANYVLTAAETAYQNALTTGNAKLIARTQQEYYAATATLKQAEATVTAKAATVGQLAVTGNLTQALKLAIVQVRAFTTALLANPFTWVAAAVAGVTAVVFAYKNELEATSKALDDINARHEQEIQATENKIQTINQLVEVKKRSRAQEEELNKVTDELIEKYPDILSNYDKEKIKLQGVNEELAKKIYLQTQAAKIEKLQKQKEKIDKKVEDQHKAYIMNNQIGAARFGTPIDTDLSNRKGVQKQLQKDQDRINKELREAQAILNKINNNELNLGFDKEVRKSSTAVSSGTTSSKDKKKTDRAAEKARKEAIALQQAQIDAQLLQVRKNSEEEYQLELKKINAKIALEKRGTAAYQQALNERTKLVQQHTEEVGQAELTAYNNKVELTNLEIEREKELLEAEKERGGVSNDEYYNKLLEFEEKKYNLKLEGLDREAELYKNDVKKYEEIQQEKLVLTADYETEKLKIETDSMDTALQGWRDAFKKIGTSFQDNLGEFIAGNQTLKESFTDVFNDIKNEFAKMIAHMIMQQARLSFNRMSGQGGIIGAIGTVGSLFFADGGIVPGNYNQATPIVAHGSEMVLNPLQQRQLWNMIASGNNSQIQQPAQQTAQKGQNVIYNQITPVFQSLDPAQGQKMFQDWMKQGGIAIVRDSIKNNNYQMRDTVRGVG